MTAGPAVRASPVVVCITETPEDRTRLAAMFDGVGVLVMASDVASARSFSAPWASGRVPTRSRLGRLTVDLAQLMAAWLDRPSNLTVHEIKVLGALARHPGRVWTYRQLHDEVWERTFFTGPVAVQSVVKRLRRKLRGPGASLEVEAVRGLGFRIAPEQGSGSTETNQVTRTRTECSRSIEHAPIVQVTEAVASLRPPDVGGGLTLSAGSTPSRSTARSGCRGGPRPRPAG